MPGRVPESNGSCRTEAARDGSKTCCRINREPGPLEFSCTPGLMRVLLGVTTYSDVIVKLIDFNYDEWKIAFRRVCSVDTHRKFQSSMQSTKEASLLILTIGSEMCSGPTSRRAPST